MLSCRDATHLASARLDRPLSRRERWSLRVHLVICSACRLYDRQIRALARLVQLRGRGANAPGSAVLSAEAKRKMKEVVAERAKEST